jgi:hypothetical protein
MAVLCMLAAGTWILSVRTLTAAGPVVTSASAEEMPAVVELIDLVDSLRLAGAFDRPAFTVESIDLTGDGDGAVCPESTRWGARLRRPLRCRC